jgi:large subunit ribosomal protein LP1
MSSIELAKLSQQDIAQLACTYAALILHDDGQDITANKITALVKAAGVKV